MLGALLWGCSWGVEFTTEAATVVAITALMSGWTDVLGLRCCVAGGVRRG